MFYVLKAASFRRRQYKNTPTLESEQIMQLFVYFYCMLFVLVWLLCL